MKLGIDRLLDTTELRAPLKGKRIAIAAHPASVNKDLHHSVDMLAQCTDIKLSAAFGPQHGMRGEKQDNMIETDDYKDPVHHIPVFSLYGSVRRPSDDMMQHFDVLLFDIQDLGCRIYTYITTLLYLMQACAKHRKALWILDRPNPAGRPIEGNLLSDGWQSFVGAAEIVMRHGLTVGEIAQWFARHLHLDLDLKIIEMEGYDINSAPGHGWPSQLAWVNPSPNASSLNMARCYAGTVLLEGTTLSEGRGTTIPLEVVGAPDIDIARLLGRMEQMAPQWLQGCILRPCYFEPTFHKHQGKLCQGFQIHTQHPAYQHEQFKPFRLLLLLFKAIRQQQPDYPLWRDFAYEYETEHLAFDVINGGQNIREWVDDSTAQVADLEQLLQADEAQWLQSIEAHLIYR